MKFDFTLSTELFVESISHIVHKRKILKMELVSGSKKK